MTWPNWHITAALLWYPYRRLGWRGRFGFVVVVCHEDTNCPTTRYLRQALNRAPLRGVLRGLLGSPVVKYPDPRSLTQTPFTQGVAGF